MKPQQSKFILPNIQCKQDLHYRMCLEFICLQSTCINSSKNILCLYCIKQLHSSHDFCSIHDFISNCFENFNSRQSNSKTYNGKQLYQLEQILIKGLQKCKMKEQLCEILHNIYFTSFKNNKNKRINQLSNKQLSHIRDEVDNYYSLQSRRKDIKKLSTTSDPQYSTPIISFTQCTNFTLISPFTISHISSNKISSLLAYPSLTTYHQPIEIFVKIQQLTPNWMGIGVYFGEKDKIFYQENSQCHIMLLSNGYINDKGNISRDHKMKFSKTHLIAVKWDTIRKLIVFTNKSTQNQASVRFQPDWNVDVHLCVTMFYKNDRISIIQSSD